MGKIITCEKCGNRINLEKLKKMSKTARELNSSGLYDYDDDSESVEKLLRENNTEFGVIKKQKKEG